MSVMGFQKKNSLHGGGVSSIQVFLILFWYLFNFAKPLMRALVITIFLCACDTWTLTAELQRRIQLLEFICFRKIIGITYKDRVTNEHVRKTIIQHIGPYEDLMATVKRRQLKWYGHVTRSDGLTKVILHGTVECRRRRGRPKKSRIDNIAEWTGKSFAETQAMAHNGRSGQS